MFVCTVFAVVFWSMQGPCWCQGATDRLRLSRIKGGDHEGLMPPDGRQWTDVPSIKYLLKPPAGRHITFYYSLEKDLSRIAHL